jgi:hypothetical protein
MVKSVAIYYPKTLCIFKRRHFKILYSLKLTLKLKLTAKRLFYCASYLFQLNDLFIFKTVVAYVFNGYRTHTQPLNTYATSIHL